jgi:hypothetical protein
MSSHWEWGERVMREHDEKRPYAPENGSRLKFRVGDRVIFTNEFGVESPRAYTVTGIYERPDEPCGQYANGARYYLDWASHWFPVKESSLRAGHSHGTRRPAHGRTV